MDNTLSKAFDLLRFPLAIMVIFLHIDPTPQVATLRFDWTATDGMPLYYMCVLTVDTLALIAVPCFFFISGYLFFVNAETLNRSYYLHKLRRRVHTLLIPYIIWNVLAAVYLWLTQDIYYSPQWLVFTIPANFPLWFLRDLIVLIIASPLIGSIASQIGRTGLIILSVLFLSNLVPSLVVCRFQSFYVFYLGAFCSLRNHCFDFPSRRIISLYGLAVPFWGLNPVIRDVFCPTYHSIIPRRRCHFSRSDCEVFRSMWRQGYSIAFISQLFYLCHPQTRNDIRSQATFLVAASDSLYSNDTISHSSVHHCGALPPHLYGLG